MHDAIADKRELLTEVCRRYGVARLEMFESAARGTDFDPRTNAAGSLGRFNPDTGLVPFDQILKLAEALSHILGRPVDLVQSAAVRNLYLRGTIELTRESVDAASRTRLADGCQPPTSARFPSPPGTTRSRAWLTLRSCRRPEHPRGPKRCSRP